MWVCFLGWEDPLEKDTETYSSIIAWSIIAPLAMEIPWTEEPCSLQSMALQRVRHDRNNLVCTVFIKSPYFLYASQQPNMFQ